MMLLYEDIFMCKIYIMLPRLAVKATIEFITFLAIAMLKVL